MTDGIPQYSVDEVKKMIAEGSAQVIDVRTPAEYDEGHIPGVPLHPMQDVTDWVGQLVPSGTYVFICRSGGRSQRVAEYVKAQGFGRIANCTGGMLAWTGDVVRD